MNQIDTSPMPEIAKQIYKLAKKIESDYGLDNISLKGIGIDGYFVALGLAYIFDRKYKTILEVDPVEISSHEGVTADIEKLDSFKEEGKNILAVDKRSKSGSLGAWLEKEYPEFTYAVLIDLSGRAKLSATNEDIGWIRWGDGLDEVYENAFKVLGLKIESLGGGKYGYTIEGPRENYFLDALHSEIDKVVAGDG